MMIVKVLFRAMKDAWRNLKAKVSYAYTINKLLPASVCLDVNSAGRWCLKSHWKKDDVLMEKEGRVWWHNSDYQHLDDLVSDLYVSKNFVVYKSKDIENEVIDNPFFKCNSLEEVAINKEMKEFYEKM